MAQSWGKSEKLCNKNTLEHNLKTSLSHFGETAGHTDMATHFTLISTETRCYNSLQTQIFEVWVWQKALCWGCCCQTAQVLCHLLWNLSLLLLHEFSAPNAATQWCICFLSMWDEILHIKNKQQKHPKYTQKIVVASLVLLYSQAFCTWSIASLCHSWTVDLLLNSQTTLFCRFITADINFLNNVWSIDYIHLCSTFPLHCPFIKTLKMSNIYKCKISIGLPLLSHPFLPQNHTILSQFSFCKSGSVGYWRSLGSLWQEKRHLRGQCKISKDQENKTKQTQANKTVKY